MKSLRMIGIVVMTILMSVGFVSCSSDEDEKTVDNASIVGAWTCPFEKDWGDTDVFEFKSDGTVTEFVYKKSVSVYEEKGKYVYANGKLTVNLEAVRELDSTGEWSSWTNREYTVVYDASIKGNKLYLSNSLISLVMDRK